MNMSLFDAFCISKGESFIGKESGVFGLIYGKFLFEYSFLYFSFSQSSYVAQIASRFEILEISFTTSINSGTDSFFASGVSGPSPFCQSSINVWGSTLYL